LYIIALIIALFWLESRPLVLGSEPFRNWKKATEKFDEHFWKKKHNSGDTSVKKRPSSDYESHKDNYTMSENFMASES
jgi:uncharacterized membrane protein (DUF106 family)